MSFFQKVFNKKPKKPPPAPPPLIRKKPKGAPPTLEEALQQFYDTEKMLKKKVTYLESRLEKEIADAKKNATTNRKAAIQSLKRKKCLEKQLAKLDGALTTLEMEKEAVIMASENANVIDSMEIGLKAIAAANKHITADKVADMMDDFADMAEDQDKIAGAICDHPHHEEDLDTDELERELAELDFDDFEDDLEEQPAAAGIPTMPDAGKDKLDKELAELAAFENDEKQPKSNKLPEAVTSSKTRPNKPSTVPADGVDTSNTRKKEKAVAALAS